MADASASADAASDVADVARDAARATPSRGQLSCAPEGPARVLAALPLTRLRIAAHANEAMLVAEYTSSFAPEPAGDSVDTHGTRWWKFDAENPGNDDRGRGRTDALPRLPEPAPETEDWCGTSPWGEDAERPVWHDGGWSRWRHASGWGGPSCSPCGTVRDRVGARGARTDRASITDVLSEFEVATHDDFAIGAAILRRYDYRGPVDEDHDVCSEARELIEVRVPNGAAFRRTTIGPRWRVGDEMGATFLSITANAERAVIAVLKGHRRIELLTVDREGRAIGDARTVHTAREIILVQAAFLQDQVVLAWSERAAERGPASIRWMAVDPRDSTAQPTPNELVMAGGHETTELSMASDGSSLALLWVDNEAATRARAVRLAVASSVEELRSDLAAGGAEVTRIQGVGGIYSTTVAVSGERVWLAHNAPQRRGNEQIRVQALRCSEAPRAQ